VGFTYVDVIIHGRRISKIVKMLVDIGSTYIVLDLKTISELGLIETPYSVELTLADGRRVKARLYLAEVEVKGGKDRLLLLN